MMRKMDLRMTKVLKKNSVSLISTVSSSHLLKLLYYRTFKENMALSSLRFFQKQCRNWHRRWRLLVWDPGESAGEAAAAAAAAEGAATADEAEKERSWAGAADKDGRLRES